MRAALAILGLTLVGVLAVVGWSRPAAAPRPSIIRLVDHLAEARRVEQRPELIEPETRFLKPGALVLPSGWTAKGNLYKPVTGPRPIHLRVDVPIFGGRDYLVKVMAEDRKQALRVLVEHAPNLEQPEAGWHRATEERAADGQVRFDWREDTPAGQTVLPVVIESDSIDQFRLLSLSVREAGARDPSIIEAAPAVSLHGLVDRPVEGAKVVSKRGARRLLSSLLSSENGVTKWALPSPPPARLSFETALVPRGASNAPMELRVEFETAAGWTTAFSQTRGGDGGMWRAVELEVPRDARGLRLSTKAAGPGSPQVVAWGNPTLRDAASHKKHVLLITLDAVRPDHLGSYGSKRPTSPFLDQLAARGARFTDVEAQRSHTWASTTSLLLGRFPQSSGVVARGERPQRGMAGLAQSFAEAGYVTARIGSPDLPRGQLSSFDVTEIADYDTDVMARLAEVGRAYADRPLFLWVHVSTAHYPWLISDEFNRFDPEWRGPYKSAISRLEFRALEDAGPIPGPLRDHLTALYDAAILQMDQRLGKTLASLDDVGFFDDAIMAVTADHGAHFGEHDIWFMHSTPWHASLQVPLILVAPRQIAAGFVIRERGLLVDVAPTLLDLAGVAADDFDGVSLRPALEGKKLDERVTVSRFDPAGYVVVQSDSWKLLWNDKREPLAWPGELKRTLPLPELALYDRRNDPDENNNVAAAHPDIVEKLRAAAERDRAEHAPGAGAHLSSEARRLLQEAGYLDEK